MSMLKKTPDKLTIRTPFPTPKAVATRLKELGFIDQVPADVENFGSIKGDPVFKVARRGVKPIPRARTSSVTKRTGSTTTSKRATKSRRPRATTRSRKRNGRA